METHLVKLIIATATICSFSILPSSAQARGHQVVKHTRTMFECESEAGELVGCLSLPSEAPEQQVFSSAKSSTPPQTSLVDRAELSGGEAPSIRVLPPNETGKNAVNTAMLSALQAEAQLRRVELFLKSGPASHGDLRVAESSRSSK